MFAIQGFSGGIAATIFLNIADSQNTQNMTFRHITVNRNPVYMFLMTLVSAGIGLVLGVIIGIILRFVSDDNPDFKLFTDYQYWKTKDMISMEGGIQGNRHLHPDEIKDEERREEERRKGEKKEEERIEHVEGY